MGPICFWLQRYELLDLAWSFGFTDAEAREGFAAMVEGALRTMQCLDLAPNAVANLVLIRPIAAGKGVIWEISRTTLTGLYRKLTE